MVGLLLPGMDRKRSIEEAGGAVPPPPKLMRLPDEDATDPQSAPIIMYQRAQLAAKVADQGRELDWARSRIEDLQDAVTALDAAPMSANYYMASCVEELELTLSQVGLSKSDENAVPLDSHPIAAALLDADIVTNEQLGKQPQILRKLTAHVILALESHSKRQHPPQDERRGRARNGGSHDGVESNDSSGRLHAADELRVRLRAVSDQLERYADRDKQNTASSSILRDELDDVRALLDIRRRRIVALELALRQSQKQPPDVAIAGAAASAASTQDPDMASPPQNGFMEGFEPGSGVEGRSDERNNSTSFDAAQAQTQKQVTGEAGQPSFNQSAAAHVMTSTAPSDLGAQSSAPAALEETQRLAASRLEELKEMLEEKKQLVSQINVLTAELALRCKGVLSNKDVSGSALYQTMEASLQQLYVKERTWEEEREATAEERAEEKRDAEEKLEEVSAAAQKELDELRKQVDDLRRVAESAKAEKDKWVMTYEARKMESNGAEALVEAAERRAARSEGMRDKLKTSNTHLLEENADLRKRVTESELRTISDADLPNAAELVARLEHDLVAQRQKCDSFIQEVESLSVMFGDLEAENARLVKLLTEKESVLSKVMSEKLRGRQQLATMKEEARALAQGREIDQEKIKNLTGQVSTSKRLAAEAATAGSKAGEEVRLVSQQLAEQRKIADEAVVSSRTAQIERDAMGTERDVAVARLERLQVEEHGDRFEVKRLTEENGRLTRELAESQQRQQASQPRRRQQQQGQQGQQGQQQQQAAGAERRRGTGDSVVDRDEIIQELMKKLHCSVVPNQPKEVALRCGHMMSRQCVSQLIAGRSRKCPLCGIAFSEKEILHVYLD